MEKSRITKIMNNWQLYLFILIPVVYIIIFSYVPMAGVQIAFKRYNARLGMWGSPWVGFTNFIRFFNSYQFRRIITNTVSLSFLAIIVSFPIPVVFALLMNSIETLWLKKTCQTIVNLPHFISVVVLVGMLNQFLNNNTGLYGFLMREITGNYPSDLFSVPNNFRLMYVFSGVWQSFGWSSIIYLAALSGVNPELHEAAVIDGASRFQRVIHVDFPSILPTVTIMLILRMGSVMSIGFEKVFLMQNSINLPLSEVISTYVYKVGLTGTNDFSFSTAIGLFNSVINLVIIGSVNFLAGKIGETSLW